ncbi:LytTR family DNA-binding domain-containing protein [Ekhidna sp.]|uniref:LytTR family DNA-binding domain-containing protein n=1 Tax=Ekhidna sp. TaxID=2608089 RepID=UPI003299DBA3
MWLSLNYDLLKKWKAILLTSVIVVITYQVLVYFHPENVGWIQSDYFSWSNLVQFVLIDQILIECITVTTIFFLLRIYAKFFTLYQIKLSLKEILLYELKFLPVLLLAFFVFAPVTLTVRFLYHTLPSPDWSEYFEGYFYSTQLYVVYLFPSLLFGYGILNVNLIAQYNEQLGKTKSSLIKEKNRKTKNRLWASDEFGELFLDTVKIRWIERENRKTIAFTLTDKYRLKENITQLEAKLDPEVFIRINRSAIVNLEYVLNYSFWENDKYILRMRDSDKEFVMSRDRLNKIKNQLLNLQSQET